MSWRVLINGTILNNPHLTGLGVYAASLVPLVMDHLLDDPEVNQIGLIGDSTRLTNLFGSRLDNAKVCLHAVDTNNPISRLLALNKIVRNDRQTDRLVYYSPTHHGVRVDGIEQVITIHDLFARLFPRNYLLQHLLFKYYLPGVLARTRTVVCDSDSTETDLRRFYSNCPDTETVYLATRLDLTEIVPVEVTDLVHENFFLFVGPNYRYKNADRLIDAFAVYRNKGLSGKLVFAGGREKYLEFLREHVHTSCPDLAADIIFLGYVETGQLTWLYQHTTALMLTTLYEGFGLPALEAMHFNCPVVASNTGSLVEVCGGAAWPVDPYSIDEIALAMEKLISSPAEREDLIIRGRQNLARFSWTKSAKQVYEILRAVGSDRPSETIR